jgi:hypothetical protein
MQLEPRHSAHLHVGDQAGGACNLTGVQELSADAKVWAVYPSDFMSPLIASRIDSSSSTTEIWGFSPRSAVPRGRAFVLCKACQHQVEPDPAAMAERYGAGTAVIVEWRERLVCSKFRFVEQPKAPRSAAGGCRNEAMQLARSTAAGLV